MTKENVSVDFRLKKIDGTRNYLLEGVKQNELMNKNHKKLCEVLNYFENFHMFISAVSGCVQFLNLLH